MRLIAALALALLTLLLSAACAPAQQTLTFEEQAQAIDRLLMCPVCPSETIDQSQATLARDMKVIVREKLAAGESKDDILAFCVARYRSSVLAEPPRSGTHLAVWVVPPMVVLVGLLAWFLIVRSMRGAPIPAAPAVGLDPYLKAVDKELGENARG